MVGEDQGLEGLLVSLLRPKNESSSTRSLVIRTGISRLYQ